MISTFKNLYRYFPGSWVRRLEFSCPFSWTKHWYSSYCSELVGNTSIMRWTCVCRGVCVLINLLYNCVLEARHRPLIWRGLRPLVQLPLFKDSHSTSGRVAILPSLLLRLAEAGKCFLTMFLIVCAPYSFHLGHSLRRWVCHWPCLMENIGQLEEQIGQREWKHILRHNGNGSC